MRPPSLGHRRLIMRGISRLSLGRALRGRQDRCACKRGGCLSMKGQADWLNSRTATDLVQEPSPLPTWRVPFILLLFSCRNQLSCQSTRAGEVGNEPWRPWRCRVRWGALSPSQEHPGSESSSAASGSVAHRSWGVLRKAGRRARKESCWSSQGPLEDLQKTFKSPVHIAAITSWEKCKLNWSNALKITVNILCLFLQRIIRSHVFLGSFP